MVIVLHRLHLEVPNHGRVFKALLRAYLGRIRKRNERDVFSRSNEAHERLRGLL